MKLPPEPLPPWLEPLLPFERYRVKVGGATLGVMEQGEGPSVLLLHGNPTWGFLWRRVAQRLKGERLRLVMPDLLGLGLSEKPTDPKVHTLEHHAALIGELIDAVLPGPLLFVGQDWGGPIGGCALASRADRVKGMVILNTVLGPPREGFRPALFHRFAKLPGVADFAFRTLGFPQRALGLAQGDRSSISGAMSRAYRWPLRERAARVAPLALARMVPDSLEHPSVPALRRCEAFARAFAGPAEIVWGMRDPVIGRALKRVEAILPRAPVTRTQAGHFLQEEVPEEIAAAVMRVASTCFQ